MRSRLYGWDGHVYGHVIAGVDIAGHHHARLLQRALADAMRAYAGRPEEGQFAAWFNSIEKTREQARRERWPGWEAPL